MEIRYTSEARVIFFPEGRGPSSSGSGPEFRTSRLDPNRGGGEGVRPPTRRSEGRS